MSYITVWYVFIQPISYEIASSSTIDIATVSYILKSISESIFQVQNPDSRFYTIQDSYKKQEYYMLYIQVYRKDSTTKLLSFIDIHYTNYHGGSDSSNPKLVSYYIGMGFTHVSPVC